MKCFGGIMESKKARCRANVAGIVRRAAARFGSPGHSCFSEGTMATNRVGIHELHWNFHIVVAKLKSTRQKSRSKEQEDQIS